MSGHAFKNSANVISPSPLRNGVHDLASSPERPKPLFIQSRLIAIEAECNEFKKREREQEEEIRHLKNTVDHLFATVQNLKERVLPQPKAGDEFVKAFSTPPARPELKSPPRINRSSFFPVWTVPIPSPIPVPQKVKENDHFFGNPTADHISSLFNGSPPRQIPELINFPSPKSVRSVGLLEMELPLEGFVEGSNYCKMQEYNNLQALQNLKK